MDTIIESLRRHVLGAVDDCERLYSKEDSYEAVKLLYSARVFLHALEVFQINREMDQRRAR